ncbi:MAG: chemotaxis protein CheW [Desulfuromonadaceae bacterium]|nr:chemotaxis protein CheW [Desulfuromonadaceae bacterium]MDD5105425.1 chemotaxis protein CheW [Desulfuromonadaceae bacterium]
MDLAKIRKKSLQLPVVATTSIPDAASCEPDRVNVFSGTVQGVPAAPQPDFFRVELPVSCPNPVSDTKMHPVSATNSSERSARPPLDVILAGRKAAGCDEVTEYADDVIEEVVAATGLEFLCLRVSDEIYGINIMDIKEIIKPREVTEVPRAPRFFPGIISLRGTIISVIDMRVRLNLAPIEPTGKERIIVIKGDDAFSGLLVDEVIQVAQVQSEDIEAPPTVFDGVDRDFIGGIGRSGGRMIILLNLEHITDINRC